MSANPFYNQQPYEDNPFNDPSVQANAYHNSGTVPSAAPYGAGVPSVPSAAPYGGGVPSVPSVVPSANPFFNQKPPSGSVPAFDEVAPAYAGGAVPPPLGATPAEDVPLSKKAKQLKEKEKELKRKEEELQAREQAGMPPNMVKNWPKCFPIVHHDLNEIPESSRRVVRQGLYSYYLLLITLTWNLICVIAAVSSAGISFGALLLAIVYLVAGIPLAWFLWYRRLYFGAKKDKNIPFAWFFLFYILHIAFCIYASVAPPVFIGGGSSFTGVLTTSKVLGKNKVVGIMYIVGCALWIIESLLSIYVWQWSLRHFRGVDQLKSEGISAAVNAATTTQMARV